MQATWLHVDELDTPTICHMLKEKKWKEKHKEGKHSFDREATEGCSNNATNSIPSLDCVSQMYIRSMCPWVEGGTIWVL
mgnify:CR=1 FL=1